MAQLKQLVDRPDVVEMHDVTAQDPKLLIHLKVCVDVRVSMLAGEEFCDFRERENCIGGEKISGVFENSLPYFYLPYCEGPTSESFPAVYTFNKTAFLWKYSLTVLSANIVL